MSRRIFYNSKGEGRTLADLDAEINQDSRSDVAATGAGGGRDRCRSLGRRSSSPRRDEPSRRDGRNRSPRAQIRGSTKGTGTPSVARNEPRPPCLLSFSVFIGNKPITEADSIVYDLNVAVEFMRQIFSPEVHRPMATQADYDVFREGIHGAVRGLYSSYEIGMRLRSARKEIDHKEGRIWNLERQLKEAEEQAENEAQKAKIAEMKTAGATGSKDVLS
ncbi:hypothetical protein CsSME_00026116 [Camellia sinensis var. sinensis]